jgi:hypothetical protein
MQTTGAKNTSARIFGGREASNLRPSRLLVAEAGSRHVSR